MTWVFWYIYISACPRLNSYVLTLFCLVKHIFSSQDCPSHACSKWQKGNRRKSSQHYWRHWLSNEGIKELLLLFSTVFGQHLQDFLVRSDARCSLAKMSSCDQQCCPRKCSLPGYKHCFTKQFLCLWDFSLQHQPGRLRKHLRSAGPRYQVTPCTVSYEALPLNWAVFKKNEIKTKGHLCSGSVTMEIITVVYCNYTTGNRH